jgi:hypothetical protein
MISRPRSIVTDAACEASRSAASVSSIWLMMRCEAACNCGSIVDLTSIT